MLDALRSRQCGVTVLASDFGVGGGGSQCSPVWHVLISVDEVSHALLPI